MRLLLCEDERELSKAMVRIFKKYNYEVDAVFDGEEAMIYLESSNYDAVVLDVMMPKKNGFEVLREARQNGNRVPIIMLTARSSVDDKVEGLDLGANDYLAKPFETKELLARLRAITRRDSDSSSSVFSLGNISLCRATFLLSSKKNSFKLASKEFQMMEMLMKNKNHIVKTEVFLEKIWGYDSEVDINIVWVYISYLRKKLKLLDADISIKATRNTGYSLEENKC